MLKNVVVFGAAGQLGVELVRVLTQRGYSVHPFNRASVDITNLPLLEQTLAALDPQAVINAAAYNQVDVAEQEPQAAYSANGLGVRNLALACRQMDALLVHFSTDYVFDGQLGRPYVEDDRPHPLGAYAVSKLAGELYAQAFFGGTVSEGTQARVRKQLERHIPAFKRLASFSPYVAGDTFTLADCSAWVSLPLVAMATKAVYGEDLLAAQGVDWKTYVKFVGERPSAQRVAADRKADTLPKVS